MAKLRVWWIPQVPMEAFYIPVESPEEGQKVMNILATYDCFQYNHNVKPDYANAVIEEKPNTIYSMWAGRAISPTNKRK